MKKEKVLLWLEIGLLIRFLVFHPIKINFVKPETCAIKFSIASPIYKLTKVNNKKMKHAAAHAPPFSFLPTKMFYETRDRWVYI